MATPSRKRARDDADSDEQFDNEQPPKRVRENTENPSVPTTPPLATPSLLGSIKKQFSRFGSLRFTGPIRNTMTHADGHPEIHEQPAEEADVTESVAPETPPRRSDISDYRNFKFDPAKSIFSGKPSPFAGRRAGVKTTTTPDIEPMPADVAEAEALRYLPRKRKQMETAAARRREIEAARNTRHTSNTTASAESNNDQSNTIHVVQDGDDLAPADTDIESASKKRKRLPAEHGMLPGPKNGGYGIDVEYLDVENIVEGVDESLLDEQNEPVTPLAKMAKTYAGQTPRSAMKKRPDGYSDGTIAKSPKNVSFQAQPLTGVKHVYAYYGESGMYNGSTFAKADAINAFAGDSHESVESTGDETVSSINSADIISPHTKRNTAINLIESAQAPQPAVDPELRDPTDSNWRSSVGNPRPGTFCVPDFDDDDSVFSDTAGDQTTPTQAPIAAKTHSTSTPASTNLASTNVKDDKYEDDVKSDWAGKFDWPALGAHIVPAKEEIMNRPMMQKVRVLWTEQDSRHCRKFWEPEYDHVLSTMRAIQASGREVTFE